MPRDEYRAKALKLMERLTAGCAAKCKAADKVQLSRLHLLLLLALVCLIGSPWLVLLWTGFVGRHQQAKVDSQAIAFLSQFPAVSPNVSAQQIDRIGAALGFSPNARYLEPVAIDQAAQSAFRNIDAGLSLFLQQQTTLLSGPLAPLPADLADYLSTYSGPIDETKQQILQSDLPQWEMNLEAMFDPHYPSPGFFNVLYLQKLILLSAIEEHHQGQTEQMLLTMDASWRLNQAIAQRPDLVSQLLSSIILAQQASLLRHFKQVPDYWQNRLASQSPQQAILTGLQFETWLKYKISQSTWSARRKPGSSARQSGLLGPSRSGSTLVASLSDWFSAQSYFKLESIKAAKTTHTALSWLATTDVCSMPQIAVERQLRKLQADLGEQETAFSSATIARRWRSAGDRALTLELSQHVIAAKQLRAEQGTWPTHLLNLDSRVCSGERWVYELTEDRITLSLSKQLITGSAVPLRYIAKRETAVSESKVP